MKRDPDKILADLGAANREVEESSRVYDEATSKRTRLILEAAEFGLPRSTLARHLNLSPNRVTQILDRARARKVNLSEVTHRVVVNGNGDDLKIALAPEENLVLFGGHGAGSMAPGDEPLPITHWSIYARARSDDDAREMVESALSGIEPAPHIASVERFDPNG